VYLITDLSKVNDQRVCPVQINPPKDKGSKQYKQWYRAFKTHLVIKVTPDYISQELMTVANFLNVYNETLLINSDCRTKDALKYLEHAIKPLLRMNPGENHTIRWLIDSHNGMTRKRQYFILLTSMNFFSVVLAKAEELEKHRDNPRCENPKLQQLKQQILEKDDGSTSRCIVFCLTRQICACLAQWAQETDGLIQLNPGYITGTNAAAKKQGTVPEFTLGFYSAVASQGLTSNQQSDVIKAFAKGDKRLIFVTNVVEEGLDVEACDSVISYRYLTNMIARVQSRGRFKVASTVSMLNGFKHCIVEMQVEPENTTRRLCCWRRMKKTIASRNS
jgi:ERCC4-related helicase